VSGHSAVNGKVEREGEADEGIDDQNNALGNIIIHEAQTETVRECVKSSDDHERYLGGEEDSNDYNQHQGGALCVSLLSAFSDQAPTPSLLMR